jgi:hypothetical protein
VSIMHKEAYVHSCYSDKQPLIPSKLVQVVKLLTCIREISGSNFDGNTIVTQIFRGIPQPLLANVGIVPLIWPAPLPSKSLSCATFRRYTA